MVSIRQKIVIGISALFLGALCGLPNSVKQPLFTHTSSAQVVECEGECEQEPTPTPTEVIAQTGGQTSPATAPVCPDGNTTKLVANLFVERSGSDATVHYFITEGNSSHIYWKLNSSSDWQYSVIDVKGNADNFVSYTIHDLTPTGDYTFGVQQVKGCGSGELATAIVVDDYLPNTFRMTYWTW